jgi:hypothetical protein
LWLIPLPYNGFSLSELAAGARLSYIFILYEHL